MLVSSKYRLVGRASWGIAINTLAEWTPLTEPSGDAIRLSDRLWFSCADKTVPAREVHYFVLGLKVVLDDIEKQIERSGPMLIEKQIERSGPMLITAVEIDYNPTDYQPEGLVPAAVCWAAEAFHFPKPDIIGKYDKARRRY